MMKIILVELSSSKACLNAREAVAEWEMVQLIRKAVTNAA